jgi:hypothetical protein
MTFCADCASQNGYVAIQNDAGNDKAGTPSSNGFTEVTTACPGWLILAATTSTAVVKAGGVVTKFEVKNGRLHNNWNCEGDDQAKARVKALCLFANELSARINRMTGKSL